MAEHLGNAPRVLSLAGGRSKRGLRLAHARQRGRQPPMRLLSLRQQRGKRLLGFFLQEDAHAVDLISPGFASDRSSQMSILSGLRACPEFVTDHSIARRYPFAMPSAVGHWIPSSLPSSNPP